MTTIDEYAERRRKREQTATKIALLLYRYSSISWCPANIRRHVTESQEQIDYSIAWLRRKEYVQGISIVFLTSKGIEFVDGLKRNVSMTTATSESRFKSEALLGIAEVKHPLGYMISEKSSLTSAVIPKVKAPSTNTTPEDIMSNSQHMIRARKAICDRLGISTEDFSHFIEDGRIKHCKACGQIGMFDRKGEGRWQPVCRKCRKKGK